VTATPVGRCSWLACRPLTPNFSKHSPVVALNSCTHWLLLSAISTRRWTTGVGSVLLVDVSWQNATPCVTNVTVSHNTLRYSRQLDTISSLLDYIYKQFHMRMTKCRTDDQDNMQASVQLHSLDHLMSKAHWFYSRYSRLWLPICPLNIYDNYIIRVVPDLTISNPGWTGPGQIQELISGQSRIWGELVLGSQNKCLMKLTASTIQSAAIRKQYSSVFPLLHLDKICGTAMDFVFLSSK